MTIALLLATVSLAGCPRSLPAELLSGSVTVTLEASGPTPTGLTVDGHPIPASALPVTLKVEPGKHELTVGHARFIARLPLVLGLGPSRVLVGGASPAAVIWPAGSHVLPAYGALTAQTGPDTFASFRGWLGASKAAVVLPGEQTYVWDLAEGTLDRLWVSPATWVSGGGRFIAGVDDRGLVVKELSTGAENALTSWPGAGKPGFGDASVVNASSEGDWFAFSFYGAHEAPVWPEVWLYRAPGVLTRICRPADFETLVPGYTPVDLLSPSPSSTLFVAVAPSSRLCLVELSLPDGALRASEPFAFKAPSVLRPCGLWGGRLLFIGLSDGPPVSGGFVAYDFTSGRLEAAALPVDGLPVFGAVNPVTGSLWVGLKEDGNRVSLAELLVDGNGLSSWRISFPVSTLGLALTWSPDGRRAILKTSWGETGLVVYDPDN